MLKVEDLPLTEPGEGEVRLKVEAIGLNRAEVMFRQGQYLQDPVLPSRLGYEATGIVDAVGPGVSGIQIEDRVSTIPSFPMGKYGVYGESAIVPEYAVARYPDSLSPVEGAAIWMQYLTAFGALVEFGLRPGNMHSADGWRDVLEPVVARYKARNLRRYSQGDAAFASPDI